MSNKLFVGNIAWTTTDDELKALFAEHGAVEEAVIIKDKFTGRSRGFGFVTYSSEEDAVAAIDKLNGTELNGRELVVNEEKPRQPRD